MFKKIIALAASVLMLAGVLAGCTSTPSAAPQPTSPAAAPTTEATAAPTATPAPTPAPTPEPTAGPVNLVFFNGTVELVDFWNQYLTNYNSTNKDQITIDQEYQQEATKALQIKMASGDTPDLICCQATQDMIDSNKFVDLTNEPWWSSLNPAVKGFCTDVKSGKAYCVAALQGAVGIYYNKTIFTELGLKPANTWADFVSNLKTIKEKKKDVTPFYMGGKDGWMLSHLAEFTFEAVAKQKLSYVDQQTAMQNNDAAKLGWDATATGAIATFASDLTGLQKDGLLNSNVVTATYDDQTTAFASGKAAVISQGLWAAGDIQKKAGDTSFVGFCQYPAIMDGAKPAIGSTIDCQFYISADSKNVEAAKKVLANILSADSMKAISEARQAPSSNPSVQSDWGYLKADVGAVLSDSAVASVTWTTMPSGFTGDDNGRVIQELLAGKYTQPVDFAKAWADAWNQGFNK